MDIKDKGVKGKDGSAEKLSPLREGFHSLANSMNGVYSIAYTYAFFINELEENKINPEFKDEVSGKIAVMDAYYKKADEDFKKLSQMLDKPLILKDCKEHISNVTTKLSEMGAMIQNVKDTQTKIKDYCIKQELVKLATELHKLPEQAQMVASLVRDLKDKLISMGKYYSL